MCHRILHDPFKALIVDLNSINVLDQEERVKEFHEIAATTLKEPFKTIKIV
jgi:hypothetical protein